MRCGERLKLAAIGRWATVRCSLVKPPDWAGIVDPPVHDSWRGLWFRLRHQPPERPGRLDPFAEPVSLVLPF